MSSLALKGNFATNILAKKGALSVVYIKKNYATDNKFNLASYKRGTGGRSSFNGLVATVFGCSGFVGKSVCNRLGKIGTQLILPYRCDFYDVQRLKVVGDLGQVLFHSFDLRDQKSIEEAVKYSNVVINLIGKDYETKNFKFKDVHVIGANNIAVACKKMGVKRLIHLSYLNSMRPAPGIIMPGFSKWKESKFEGEAAVKQAFPDATIIKASDICGSEDRFIKAIAHPWRRSGKMFPLHRCADQTEKQPVYVMDVAAGIVNCVKDDDTMGKEYHFVGPRRYLLPELVDWMHRVMRKDAAWGYRRYDMARDPTYPLRIAVNNLISTAWPYGYLHWEQLEKEVTTDVIRRGVPGLEDLGVEPTPLEEYAAWVLKPHRAHNYYMETVGEFPDPGMPKTVPLC